MTSEALDGEPRGMAVRVRDILIRPQTEWRRIAAEEPAPLLGSYVVPLTLLGAVVSFGASVAYSGGVALNASLVGKVVSAILYVIFAVGGVAIGARMIGWLAPRFGAERNDARAMQLAAYSATPVLIAALAAVAPPIAGGVFAAALIYAFVLLALGMQSLMPLADPSNNVPRFTILFAAIFAGIAALVAAFLGPVIHSGREALTGAIETVAPPPAAPELPRRSGAELALERLTQADAALILTDPARLAEQFPDSLPGGFARQSVVTGQRGGVSRADAIYRDGAATLSVAMIQYARNVDPLAFAAQLDAKPDGPLEGGYARTQSIDGRFYAEEVQANASRYIVIGRGVVMVARGDVTMDEARAAVETIGMPRLEGMFGR